MQINRFFVTALFVVPFLFACGGGGGGDSSSGSDTTTSKVLASISITPAAASIATGLTTSFTATGKYSDNTTADITSEVIWTSSNNAVATISTTGVAAGVSFGAVAVIATLNDISSPAAQLAVSSAVVTDIAISPSSPSSPKGTPVTLTATGTYSDGTTDNISGSVTWASSDSAVATLNGSGIASTLAQGSTTITASTNGITSNSATLTVTAPEQVSLSITPSSATITVGSTQQFSATGTYTDGSTADMTSQVAWASMDTTVATIDNVTGVASGVAPGGTEVTATLNGITSPAAQLNVTSAAVTAISITPTTPSSPKGTPVTFTATGTYSDGTTGNISGSVTWASSNTAVATLNGSGIASTLAEGSTTITASTNGITSSSATLTVTAPELASLSITPSSVSVTAGNTQQFTASGTLSDGTAATLGPLTWTSSDILVATIDSTGLMTTLAVGSTNISANSGGVASNTAVVTVVPQPPTAPIGVFAVSGTNQATVSWSPVADATAYNIYWGTAPGITSASTKFGGTTSPYLHTGLTTGSTYYYRVSAVNAGGETLSDEVFSFVYSGGNPAGAFGATGSLATARQEHTATLMPNGKVLIAGGHSQSTYYATAEIYDPVAGVVSATTNSMVTERDGHTATLLPDGRVLMVGGISGFGIQGGVYGAIFLASAELFDHATGLVSSTESVSEPRINHSATLLPNGKVLIIGGSNNSAGFLSSAELYDPTTGLFAAAGSMSVARSRHTATLLSDGKVLVTGGQDGGNFLSSAEIYDSVTNNFNTVNDMTAGRVSHTATLLPSGKVLVTGGFGGTGAVPIYHASAELYDPATGTFSATGSMATARWLHATTLLPNGMVLVSGGRDGGVGANAVAAAELYDPTTGIFNVTGNMGAARQYHTITPLPNGSVLAAGGFDGVGALSSAELFR